MVKKLIVTADDFGLSAKVNQGIVQSFKNGVVTGVSLFADREGSAGAFNIIKENPQLSVGIHLDLDRFFEIDHQHGIIKSWNVTPELMNGIRGEIKRQFELILGAGITPAHISSNHWAHMVKEVFTEVCEAAKNYNIGAVRLLKRFFQIPENYAELREHLNRSGLVTVEHVIEGWYWGNIDEEFSVAELITHPGYGELWREYELVACCDVKLKDYLKDNNFQLITFKDLKKNQ